MAVAGGWRTELVEQLQGQQQRTGEWAVLVGAYNELRARHHTLEARSSEQGRELKELQAQREDERRELQRLREDAVQASAQQYKARVEDLEGRLAAVKEELTGVYRDRALQAERQLQLLDTVRVLREEAQDSKKELQAREDTISALRQQVEQKAAIIHELEEAMEVLGRELGTVRAEQAGLQEKVQRLEAENESLIERWLQMNSDMAERLNEINTHSSRMSETQRRVSLNASRKAQQPAIEDQTEPPMDNHGQSGGPGLTRSQSDFGRRGSNESRRSKGSISLGPVDEDKVADVLKNLDKPILQCPGFDHKFTAHQEEVNYIAFSPNGSLMATCGGDSKVHVWEQGGRLRTTLSGATQGVTCCDFGYRDDMLLAACNDKAVRLYQVATARIKHTLTGHQNKVLAVRSNGDSTRAFSGSQDRTIIMWDLHSGYNIKTFFPNSVCHDLVLMDDSGTGLMSSHADGHIRIYDTRSRQCTNDISNIHASPITSLDLSTDRALLLTSARDNSLKLVDVRMTNNVVATFNGEGYRSSSNWAKARLAHRGQYAVTGAADGSVYVWATNTAKVDKILKEHKGPVSACAYNQSTGQLATGDKDHVVCLWNL